MSAPVSSESVQPLASLPPDLEPAVDHLVTEDDTPVDNIYSEKQQRLLTRPLYGSWSPPGDNSFVALTNVGMFFSVDKPPLVPDFLLSLGVRFPDDIFQKKNRSYFIWKYGKQPDVALEVVSNTEGRELDHKKHQYAQIGIPLYVVWDPYQFITDVPLQVFFLRFRTYEITQQRWFPEIGLGLTVWHGAFETMEDDWLRWCDEQGVLIPLGDERADQEAQRARQEQRRAEEQQRRAEEQQRRADHEHQRAEQERERAERLAAQLRDLGVEPNKPAS